MKIMIITGASRGIGAATALLAAGAGYTVVVNYNRQKAAAEEVVANIVKSNGNAISVQADVSKEDDVFRLFAEADALGGEISCLVNNAGTLETQATVHEISTERLRRMLNVNVVAPFLCIKEAVKRMSIKNGGPGGTIVNVSSIAARTGSPGEYVDYAACKGALDTMTIGLSKELADDGIRVNSVRPGFIYTDIHADGGEPGRVDRIKESLPLKRGGRAEEVAEAILWLATDKSSFSTGIFLDVTGGR